MAVPNMKELYQPYSNDASLEVSLAWWKKQAKNLGISENIVEWAIAETFTEMEAGKTFEIGNCHCSKCGEDGFPTQWSCVAINHYVLEKMLSKHREVEKETLAIMQGNINTIMESIAARDNKDFIKKNTRPNIIKRIWKWLISPSNSTYQVMG